jgi:hypothetical protein
MRTKPATVFALPLLAMACLVPAILAAEATPPPDRSQYGDPAEHEARDRPVTLDDIRILVRTSELLAQDSAWNRSDDRQCQDDEASGRVSLFCALQAASVEVLGRYDHRRVALQEVRFAIQEATRGREFEHRLMEFNNLPETSLADVQAVLKIARERVEARLAAAPSPDGQARP